MNQSLHKKRGKFEPKVKKTVASRYFSLNNDMSKTNEPGVKKEYEPYKTFKIVYTNTTSLNNKILELELYLRCKRWPHVVSFAETLFSETSVPTIDGYLLYRRDRDSTHGGVCIYVRNYVSPK